MRLIKNFFQTQKTLISRSGAVFVLRLFGMLLAFCAMSLIGNKFGAEVYGRFSLAMVSLQFITLIVTFGIPLALMKLTASKENISLGKPKNSFIQKSIFFTTFFSLIGAVIIFLLKEEIAITWFKDAYFENYLLTIALLITPVALHNLVSEFFRGLGRFKIYALSMYVLPYSLFLVLFIIFNKMSFFEEYMLFVFYLLGITAVTISLIILKSKSIFYKTKARFPSKTLFELSFPMMFSAAFIFITNWTDIFMLGAMVSKADLGIYNAAYKLAVIALVVINAVNTVLAPKIAALYSENKVDQMKTEVIKATKLITLSTLPIVLLLILFRNFFLSLFGNEFVKGEYVLIIVALGLLFNSMSGIVGQVMNMTKHQRDLRNFTIIVALLNIIFNYILIPKYGIQGAAIASLISTVILNTLCIMFIKKKFDFYAFFRL